MRWWDLPAIAARHQAFLSAYGSVGDGLDPRGAFGTWIGCLDVWRVIPYVDPDFRPPGCRLTGLETRASRFSLISGSGWRISAVAMYST